MTLPTRVIPKSGEAIPILGLGTWSAFDVGDGAEQRAPLAKVLDLFHAAGGRLIDSSPMYGRAEAVVGDLNRAAGRQDGFFLATKVWVSGKAAAEKQMATSVARMGPITLMQVHNLLDWRTHLPVLREKKRAGTFRYIGVTHYQLDALDELERLLRGEALDFVQLPYSVAVRDAEKRLLPAARDTGTAVLVMRPFEGGELFEAVRGKPLPAVAGALGATSWAQLFLKFVLAHPAVTCPIPATRKPAHLEDNLMAAQGPLPDQAQRALMLAALGL